VRKRTLVKDQPYPGVYRKKSFSCLQCTIRYDMIEEFNMDSNAEYSA